MTDLQFLHNRKRARWQMYLGVGILSTLAGYGLSAVPQLIVPMSFVGISIWLIYSGLQRRPDEAVVPSPVDLAQRTLTKLTYWRRCLKSRWGQYRYASSGVSPPANEEAHPRLARD